jgi:hypothetical protein
MKLFHSSARIQNAMRSNQLPECLFKLCIGITMGVTLAFLIYSKGGGTHLDIHSKSIHHPIADGIQFGFFYSVPFGILYYIWRRIRHRRAHRAGRPEPPFPRFVGRPAMVFTCITTLLLLTLLDQ